jgi:LruC domain-containing protein
MNKLIKIVLYVSFVMCTQSVQAEINSTVFSDVIKSNGTGVIDLMNAKTKGVAIDALILEEFRINNQGKLIFAVDVNEASDGSENADSQGVTVASATLVVTIDSVDYIYDDFSTKTQSILAAKETTDRQFFYTLLGTAGNSLITPSSSSELNGSSFDSTLSLALPIDISSATKAVLTVNFLAVNDSLGDPENYYDFSNGFEQIAIVTAEDAAYLDQLAPGRDLAPLVISDETEDALNWSYFPSSDSYYVVAYEDLFPNRGDYDFNDLVTAYQVKFGKDKDGKLRKISGNGFLIARGASYDHNWYLGIDLPSNVTGRYSVSFFEQGSNVPAAGYPLEYDFSGRINLLLAENVAQNFYDNNSTYVNTFAEQSIVQGPKFEFEINFEQPINHIEVEDAPFDPFLYVHDTGYEIHLVNKEPTLSFSMNQQDDKNQFKDQMGFPFAMLVSENWLPPIAGEDMGVAYPEFIEHVASQGANKKSWFDFPDNSRVKSIPFKNWSW